ncbi:hypothetical protein [cyanobacterium endosymbiont of Rhopalodia gibberula]|uniref:hypothetical protein n=1 Tax=cyanobacterium endosymbiont of Rhopalodia gibberula TaxID=1763363 RepID=UPI000E648DF4|nr:hypothetical protein [cyanobacterium endosymbiont of Rhopalodia gibberula]
MFNTPKKIQAITEGKLSMIVSLTSREFLQIALNTLIKGINEMELDNAVETDSGLQYVKIKEGIRDFRSKGQTVREHQTETLENRKNLIIPVIVSNHSSSKLLWYK